MLCFFNAHQARATFDMNENCTLAYQAIFDLEFKKASAFILQEKIKNPDNDALIFMEGKILFLTAFISETKADFDKLKSFKEFALNKIEKQDHKNPYYRLSQAEILLQTAVVKIKFREFISAAFEIRRAYLLLETNAGMFPGFFPNLKSLGILHALIGAVPDNYQWIVKLIGLEGNIRLGINELETLHTATKSNTTLSWLQTETEFLLIFSQHHLLKDDIKTNEYISTIDLREASPLLFFVVANYYNTTGKSNLTIELMKLYKVTENTYQIPYLDYMFGSSLLYNLDERAEKYYLNYLTTFKGLNFIKSANQKLACIRFIQGDTASYFEYMQKAQTLGNDFVDEDKQALKESLTKEIPNLYLLRSRMLFDGGYYQRALSEIAGKKINSFPHLKDQLELTYRMARIFDKTSQKEKAKSYYEMTFKNGERQTWYFAANAALNLGIIYELEGNKNKAAEYYKKCLAMRNHDYQNSIDQKARAGLNRLQHK